MDFSPLDKNTLIEDSLWRENSLRRIQLWTENFQTRGPETALE